MTFIVADRIKETSTSTGTTPFALGGAMTGFKTFASRCAVGDTMYYAIQSVDGAGSTASEWECGLGTYSAANTLTRTTVTSSSNADALVNFSAGSKQAYITMPAVQVMWMRERLAAARTYYVRTDGSNSNSGLENTAGGAFLTIQKACDIAASLDAQSYQVTCQLADGTYNESVVVRPMLGALPLIIRGNNTTPANVVVNGVACFTAGQPGAYCQVLDLKMIASSIGITASYTGKIEFGNVNFGAATNRHVNAQYGGLVNCLSS